MKAKGIAFDPTLSVVEGLSDLAKGKTDLLKRSLVQQVTTKELLAGTEHAATNNEMKSMREGLSHYPLSIELGNRNLLKAWQAGCPARNRLRCRQLSRPAWTDCATRNRALGGGGNPG